MAQYVKPLVRTLLSVEEIQDCGIRCRDLFLNSSLAAEPFLLAQTTAITEADSAINEARRYEKKNSETVTSKEADDYRDRRFSIFNSQVESKMDLLEDEPEMAQAAISIKAITEKHCNKLHKMDRVTETVSLKALFTELDISANYDLITNAEVERYYIKLKDAQAQYEAVDLKKINEAVAKGEYVKPVDSAEKILYRLDALFSYLDALYVDNQGQYGELADAVNKVIDSVVIPARARKSRKETEAE